MTDFETIARNDHRSGMNCAMAVYNALATANENKTVPPMPRAEGGKCGTVLAAEQIIREMGGTSDMSDQGWHIFYEFLCKCDLFTSRFKVPRLTGIFTEER